MDKLCCRVSRHSPGISQREQTQPSSHPTDPQPTPRWGGKSAGDSRGASEPQGGQDGDWTRLDRERSHLQTCIPDYKGQAKEDSPSDICSELFKRRACLRLCEKEFELFHERIGQNFPLMGRKQELEQPPS